MKRDEQELKQTAGRNPEDGGRDTYIRIDVNNPVFWLVTIGTVALVCLNLWLLFSS
jgi:hypothetical protein